LNVKSIVQSPTYPPDSLVSNVGGALSLYLGIAIIMAFELVELFWDILVALFSHCANSKPKKQFDISNTNTSFAITKKCT